MDSDECRRDTELSFKVHRRVTSWIRVMSGADYDIIQKASN